jgi:hypothetical protein
MKRILIILLFCASSCKAPVSSTSTTDKSYVLGLRKIAIGISTESYIHGHILSIDTINNQPKIDSLQNVTVRFINQETSDSVIVASDKNGFFQGHIRHGVINVTFSLAGKNSLEVRNILLLAGELKQLDVALVTGKGKTIVNMD